ncbi:MAG: helix-turn-helix transcriptional regulator [Deltaproteobacteria bacterium]|nr:helix-turn-helix transcriptional regulator [Deltaproteobacteria bacterium]
MSKDDQELLTTVQIARFLHLNEKKIYALASEGRLPAVRISGKWLFPRDLVEQYLRENSSVPAEGLLKRLLPNVFIVAGSDDLLFREIVYDAGKIAGYPVAYSVLGTHGGMDLLSKNQVHAVTAHFPVEGAPTGVPRGGEFLSITLYHRAQGIMLWTGQTASVRSCRDIVERGLRFAVREKECSTYTLSESLFRDAGRVLEKYDHLVGPYLTHREAARAVAAGEADATVGIKGAAAEHGLEFVPVTQEEFRLVMPSAYMAEPKVVRLVDALVNCIKRAPAALLVGYDTAPSGKVAVFAVPAGRKAERS